MWCRIGIFLTDREVECGEEIQEGKARRPSAQEEGDEEGDAGEEEKETGAKARARSDRSVAVAWKFRRQDRRSIDHHPRQQRHRATPIVRGRPHSLRGGGVEIGAAPVRILRD